MKKYSAAFFFICAQSFSSLAMECCLKAVRVAPFIKTDSKKTAKKELLRSILEVRLKAQQDHNAPLIGGQELLQESATSDVFLEITQALLAHHIDPNQHNPMMLSPLCIACSHLAAKTVDVLLEARAKVTASTINPGPLHIICDPDYDSVIPQKVARRLLIAKSLIAHGADPQEKDSSERNSFYFLETDPLARFDPELVSAHDTKMLFDQRAQLKQIVEKR